LLHPHQSEYTLSIVPAHLEKKRLAADCH